MIRTRTAALPVVALATLLATAGPARAQNFEAFYGEADWRDRGEDVKSVRFCPGGGSIAAGTRAHPALGSETLVTRVDDLGATLWQRSYQVGGARSSGANAVIEIGDSAGGFALAGSVSRVDTRMYVMRIDCDGNPRWTRLFANQGTAHRSIAYDLVEIPATATNPRPELLVIGDEQFPGGTTQGRIARLDAGGVPLFDLAYVDPTAPPGIRFRAATLAPDAAGAFSHLVVAGSAGRFTDWNFDRRGLMFRVRIDGTPVCNAVLGRFDSGSEDYLGTTTLRTPATLRGQTVLVGATVPAAGTVAQRGYLTRFRATSCVPLAQSFWPFPNETAHTIDVHEYPGSIGASGRIAVTGTVTAGAFSEGYVAWASSTTLAPFAPVQRFGLHGTGGEVLRALDLKSDRLILAGSTATDWDGSGDRQDLFLVQPEPFLRTMCSLPHTIAAVPAALPYERFDPIVNRVDEPRLVDTRSIKVTDEGYCCALSPL